MVKLNEELTDADKKTFNFDLSSLNWPDFMDDYVKVLFISPLSYLHIVCMSGHKAVCFQRGSLHTGRGKNSL